MTTALRGLVLILMSLAFVACASGGAGAPAGESAPAATKAPVAFSNAPAGSALAKITEGMNDAEVRKLLGDPDNANAYMTGKGWIPFYYGPDTHRSDWIYRGKGRVVFSRNRYSGGLKAIRVISNPNEQ